MKQQFYSHLTQIDTLLGELDALNLKENEKIHLTTVIHSSMHTVILDVVMSELSEIDKKQFLHHLHENNHDTLWTFLKKRTTRIEEKITKAAQELREEFLKDIKEVKK